MNDERFDLLLDAWLDGGIADSELGELQTALAEPARQERFLARCRLEGALRRSGAAAPLAQARPSLAMPAMPLAGALLAAAAITLLLLPGSPAVQEPVQTPARTVTVRVNGASDGSVGWAVATQTDTETDNALALSFIPIVTNHR
jgi:hypothetical protein